MIHSLAGGVIRDMKICDFAKVELSNGMREVRWYINPFLQLKVGDKVLVPVGIKNDLVEAVVLKIERNVNEQVAPVPIKRAKEIFKIIEK